MENKYYTPELIEFHVGFDYEALAIDGNSYDDSDWNKFTFGVYDNFEFDCDGWRDVLKEYVYREIIRVKYLDKEDIESFGFEQIEYDTYQLNDIYFEFNNEYKTFIYEKNKYDENIFVGNIKNKSELKRLLIQLGITKE